ncbi:MAG: hypothetical protein ACXU9W_13315 [Thermodesulfobacteriota bacterium]
MTILDKVRNTQKIRIKGPSGSGKRHYVKGQTIIMVTHSPENTGYSTRTISLRDGRVDAVSIA